MHRGNPLMNKIIEDSKKKLQYDTTILDNSRIYFQAINPTQSDEYNSIPIGHLNNNSVDIMDPNAIVYPHKNMTVSFNYPTIDEVSFLVRTSNEAGFTRKELVIALLKRYRFLKNANAHYNLDTGLWNTNQTEGELFCTAMGNYEYDETSITGLCYNKDDNVWVVEFSYYI
jgi:hypothetical protein